MPGKGVVTIEWPKAETIDRVVWGRDREGQYRDRLATEYYLEVGDRARRMAGGRLVAGSRPVPARAARPRPAGRSQPA